MAKELDKYFKVIATEKAEEADILLYGVIGQDFWWDSELNEESITDIAFVKTFRQLEAKYSRINIRINSPGGSMYHGNAIISTIQSSTAEVHAYIDGLAASMAGDIWLAAPNRHMSINSLVMIHSPATIAWGTAKDLRNEAEVLDKFAQTAIAVMAKATGMSEEEVKNQFYDYEDHWFTASEAEALGFISKVEEYEIEEVIEDVNKMTYAELVKHFTDNNDKESLSFLDRIKSLFSNRSKAQKHLKNNKSDQDMTLEDFKKSIESADLSIDDITKVLFENGYEVTKKEEPIPNPQEETNQLEEVIKSAVESAVKPLNDTIEELKTKVKELEETPGADLTLATNPTKTEEELDDTIKTAKEELDDYNNKMAEAAKNNETVRVD